MQVSACARTFGGWNKGIPSSGRVQTPARDGKWNGQSLVVDHGTATRSTHPAPYAANGKQANRAAFHLKGWSGARTTRRTTARIAKVRLRTPTPNLQVRPKPSSVRGTLDCRTKELLTRTSAWAFRCCARRSAGIRPARTARGADRPPRMPEGRRWGGLTPGRLEESVRESSSAS